MAMEQNGFDLRITKLISESVNIPVIASGGAGKMEDFETFLIRQKQQELWRQVFSIWRSADSGSEK
jgi:imidazole glycerol phosphate synthase subunit HisF